MKASAVDILQPTARARRIQRGEGAGKTVRWDKGIENGQGRTSRAIQIVMCGDVSLTYSLSESAVPLGRPFPGLPGW